MVYSADFFHLLQEQKTVTQRDLDRGQERLAAALRDAQRLNEAKAEMEAELQAMSSNRKAELASLSTEREAAEMELQEKLSNLVSSHEALAAGRPWDADCQPCNHSCFMSLRPNRLVTHIGGNLIHIKHLN